MYLKINYESKTKKVPFRDEWKALDKFRAFLSSLTNIPAPEMLVTFKDTDNEQVVLADEADLQYFLVDTKDAQFASITVDRRPSLDGPSSSFQERRQTPNSDVVFQNITTDVSVSIPPEPFHVDQSDIRAPLEKYAAKTSDLGLLLAGKEFADPTAPDQPSSVPQKDSNSTPLTEDVKPPANSELEAKPLNKTREPKPISAPIQIVAKKKEVGENSQLESEILLEKSQFGVSVLDRICALEKKIDYMRSSQVNILAPPTFVPDTVRRPVPTTPTTIVQTRHIGVTCSQCGATPIVGKRFVCLECPAFDACEDCETAGPHPHLLIRSIVTLDEQKIAEMRKKYGKLVKRDRKGIVNNFFETVAAFKKPAAGTQPPKEQTDPEAYKKMLEFIDGDRVLDWNAVSKKHGHLSLQDFCAAVNDEIRSRQKK